ncbi:tetratricopeptide repeat protein [Microbulbifer sp. EKSA008]|uniref:tetratricopeptide repeat protein n=1 Tax=Microbulbifer sp. EKSA008 TaxID=3243367 RepID=UPI0040415DC2
MKLLFGLTLVLLATGCSQSPSRHVEIADSDHVLSGKAVFGRPVEKFELPSEELLDLDNDIESYLSTISPGSAPDVRLKGLLGAFRQGDMQFEYDADSTLPAIEAYHRKRGNCLTFTLLMVAMARQLGAQAYFNEVDVPPVWNQDEAEIFVVYRHVNMVSEHARGRRVIDFNLAAYDPIYKQQKLEDRVAFALYYSNRGVELMREGEERQAFLYLRKAIQLHPNRADLWSNLGAFYSHFNHLDEAEQSYLQALNLQKGNLVANSNLERLYRSTGREVLADGYADRVRYHRERNPYYIYYQAREAYENGKFKLAEKRLRRAIRADSSDHRFHFLLGLTRYQLGDVVSSRESFTEAFSLVNNLSVKNRYMNKLEFLMGAGE